MLNGVFLLLSLSISLSFSFRSLSFYPSLTFSFLSTSPCKTVQWSLYFSLSQSDLLSLSLSLSLPLSVCVWIGQIFTTILHVIVPYHHPLFIIFWHTYHHHLLQVSLNSIDRSHHKLWGKYTFIHTYTHLYCGAHGQTGIGFVSAPNKVVQPWTKKMVIKDSNPAQLKLISTINESNE